MVASVLWLVAVTYNYDGVSGVQTGLRWWGREERTSCSFSCWGWRLLFLLIFLHHPLKLLGHLTEERHDGYFVCVCLWLREGERFGGVFGVGEE